MLPVPLNKHPMNVRAIALFAAFIIATAVPCSTLNASAIRLITFDLFACLADTAASLTTSVEIALPGVTPLAASNIVTSWINSYGSYAGTVFGPPASTGGLEPFPYVNQLSLSNALNSNGYSTITPGTAAFTYLSIAWGNLTMWESTASTLALLSSAGYLLGILSNGDSPTLVNATAALLPGAPMHALFSSDRPVGAFKPASAMYAQAIVVRAIPVDPHLQCVATGSRHTLTRGVGIWRLWYVAYGRGHIGCKWRSVVWLAGWAEPAWGHCCGSDCKFSMCL